MDTHIHHELLSRLHSAIDREMAISVGLAGQIVEASRRVSVPSVEEYEARRRVNVWPSNPQRDATSGEDLNTSLNAAGDGRRDARRIERLAGREAVRERTIRDLATAAQAAGADVGVACSSSPPPPPALTTRPYRCPTRPPQWPA